MTRPPLQELYNTRKIPLVDKAYYSIDFKKVIVEVRLARSKICHKLYFDYNEFQAVQVTQAIADLT